MNVQQKLRQWQQAGLIEAPQVQAILNFEQQRARPYGFYALGGLGALAIGIGLLSLVAANWADISASTKLGLDLVLGLLLALGILRADARRSLFAREILLVILMGYVGASIGLVSQIYQLGGKVEHALLLWTVVTLPAMLYLVTPLGTMVALLMVVMTWFANVAELIKTLLGSFPEIALAGTVAYVTTVALLALGSAQLVRQKRPALASSALRLGTLGLWQLSTVGQLAFYLHMRERDVSQVTYLCAASVVITAGVLWWVANRWLSRRTDPATASAATKREHETSSLLLGLVVVVMTLGCIGPLVVVHDKLVLLPALWFLLLWSLIGYLAMRVRSFGLFRTATAMIAIRLLIVYFEVIGSLAASGLGMILGGALTLLAAWLWRKKTLEVGGRMAQAKAAEAEALTGSEGEMP